MCSLLLSVSWDGSLSYIPLSSLLLFFFFLFLPFWNPRTMGIPTDNCSPRPQAPPTLMSVWRAPSFSVLMLWPQHSAFWTSREVSCCSRARCRPSGLAQPSLALQPTFSASLPAHITAWCVPWSRCSLVMRNDLHLPTAELSLNSKSQFPFFISLPVKIFSSFKTLLGGIYLFQEAFPKTVFHYLSA